MLAAYAIVRYVIVKPVLHLKDVSDQVARGNLELRADIRTGDEFEELSHTFNRMLRHLVTVQDELRAVNTDLDGKVDQLAQVNLRLYEMNKLKDDFLATMSHELRTPLNSILGFSDILARSENLSDKQKRFVRNIQTSGNALMVMINDLLDLAKIESGRVEIQVVECSLADLVERQIGLLNPLADKRNIDLSYEIDPAIPPLLQDSVKIQQILNNLLSNAIKFTPEGGRVRVRARRVDEVDVRVRGRRYGHRHSPQRAGHDLREVPPRTYRAGPKRRHDPRIRRNGTGAFHRQGAVEAPGGRGFSRQRIRKGEHLQRPAADATRRAALGPRRRALLAQRRFKPFDPQAAERRLGFVCNVILCLADAARGRDGGVPGPERRVREGAPRHQREARRNGGLERFKPQCSGPAAEIVGKRVTFNATRKCATSTC